MLDVRIVATFEGGIVAKRGLESVFWGTGIASWLVHSVFTLWKCTELYYYCLPFSVCYNPVTIFRKKKEGAKEGGEKYK